MASITLKIGESKTVELYTEQKTANGTGISACDSTITWETVDANVASVTTGLVMGSGSSTSAAVITGVWLGTTTVTGTSASGQQDTITVHVVEDTPNSQVRIGVIG